ncbi:MAG: Phosphoglycerate kinase [Patescibacteria group bacterium]|jgi:phosphoglycerate kinase|nr:Phosphoglycerate kinase [Patescibacteria group bacterium]
MISLRSVEDASVQDKRVLLRVDFNVPMQDGRITDDTRIKAALPTIKLLLDKGAKKITLLTHLGRPDGKENDKDRVAPLFAHLVPHLGDEASLVEMHENVRFDPREEAGDEGFAKELAALGDIYVNDAFSNSHRAHTSMVALPKLLPSYAGLQLLSEVAHISEALTPPKNSLAIVGGAKFETKEPLLEKLLEHYGTVLLGGALANDMLKVRGTPIGRSMVSATPVPDVMAADERIVIPTDVMVECENNQRRTAYTADVRSDERIMDIGPNTAEVWASMIHASDFVLWNGPTGVFEKGFTEGTQKLATAIVEAGCRAVLGGGDTAAALASFQFDTGRIFVSTGGGAMLEFLANGGTLPALEVLKGN